MKYMSMAAIIIAGGGLGAQFGESYEGVRNRALIPIHKKPMVSYIIRALRQCPLIDTIALVAPASFAGQPFSREADFFAEQGRDETENILRGIEVLGEYERILMVTSDLPLLTGDMVTDFLKQCPADCDICYPFVEKNDVERVFPTRKWVFVKMKEGRFTGSSMFVFSRSSILEHRKELEKVMNARRDVLKLASLWGLPVLVRLLLGILTIETVEKKISAILGCTCRGVISTYPEIAMDVDKPGDIKLVEEIVEPL